MMCVALEETLGTAKGADLAELTEAIQIGREHAPDCRLREYSEWLCGVSRSPHALRPMPSRDAAYPEVFDVRALALCERVRRLASAQS